MDIYLRLLIRSYKNTLSEYVEYQKSIFSLNKLRIYFITRKTAIVGLELISYRSVFFVIYHVWNFSYYDCLVWVLLSPREIAGISGYSFSNRTLISGIKASSYNKLCRLRKMVRIRFSPKCQCTREKSLLQFFLYEVLLN